MLSDRSSNQEETPNLIEFVGRVSPLCYYAAFKAAVDARIDEIHLSSGWRLMIGSVLHRVGVGLDVNYLLDDGMRMDRIRSVQPECASHVGRSGSTRCISRSGSACRMACRFVFSNTRRGLKCDRNDARNDDVAVRKKEDADRRGVAVFCRVVDGLGGQRARLRGIVVFFVSYVRGSQTTGCGILGPVSVSRRIRNLCRSGFFAQYEHRDVVGVARGCIRRAGACAGRRNIPEPAPGYIRRIQDRA